MTHDDSTIDSIDVTLCGLRYSINIFSSIYHVACCVVTSVASGMARMMAWCNFVLCGVGVPRASRQPSLSTSRASRRGTRGTRGRSCDFVCATVRGPRRAAETPVSPCLRTTPRPRTGRGARRRGARGSREGPSLIGISVIHRPLMPCLAWRTYSGGGGYAVRLCLRPCETAERSEERAQIRSLVALSLCRVHCLLCVCV
jgi:hypothetical protein